MNLTDLLVSNAPKDSTAYWGFIWALNLLNANLMPIACGGSKVAAQIQTQIWDALAELEELAGK